MTKTNNFTIWVDADACPIVIKEIILRAALKRCIKTIFVANKYIALPKSEFISAIQVAHGPDIADQYITEHVSTNDLVITQDIPLASILVSKGIPAISMHGTLFNEANIGERLAIRNILQDVRDQGGYTKGPKPYNPKDKQQFAETFDQQLTKLSKKKIL